MLWDNLACVHDNPAFPRDRDRAIWFLNVLNDRPIEPLAACHHGLSHRNGSAAIGGTCVDGVIDSIQQIDDWYTGRYLKLVSLIDGIAEGDGTMLDSSAVMWLRSWPLATGNSEASCVNGITDIGFGTARQAATCR